MILEAVDELTQLTENFRQTLVERGFDSSALDYINLEKIVISAIENKKNCFNINDLEQPINIDLISKISEKSDCRGNRVLGVLRRYLHSLQQNKADLQVYDQIPTEGEMLQFYNAANKSVEEKRANKPWLFVRGYGERTFKVLEIYLKTRGLI